MSIERSGQPAKLVIRRTLDQRGFERLREYLSPEGEISSRVLVEHDDRGTLTRQSFLTPEDQVIQEQLYEPGYENDHLVTYIQKDANGKLVGQTIYDYNEKGELVVERQEDRKGNVDARYEMDYQDGLLREKRFYNAADKLEGTTVYEYDEQGRLFRTVKKGRHDRIRETRTYTYEGHSPQTQPATILRVSKDHSSRLLYKFGYTDQGETALEEVYRLSEAGEEQLLRRTTYELVGG